jgi:pimeloyl-ACP methyl ester carboxylesterase
VTHAAKPTVVLVHEAFEDASSWRGKLTSLRRTGYPVIAPAVPPRGVASDSAHLISVVRAVTAPVLLVGRSCGGMVVTGTAAVIERAAPAGGPR